jgi:transcriptional regulator with XRE-family HTH domain
MTLLVKDPIDAHVGAQVKLRRAVVGMSQTELADRLGITFQQVQKYEKGANRISASRIYLIAEILGVPLESFFEGARDETITKYEEFVRSPAGIDFCKAFVDIDHPLIRKCITALVKSIAAV